MNIWLAFGILVLVILVLSYTPAFIAGSCPSHRYGTGNRTLIKYFSSPFCISCWQQKPVIESLAREQGERFEIVEYDADFCASAAAPSVIRGIPSFIANGTVIYGYQDKEALMRLVNA